MVTLADTLPLNRRPEATTDTAIPEKAMRYRGPLARTAALGIVSLVCLIGFGLAPAAGQTGFNEREVKADSSPLDPGFVWAFDFRFKDPRIVTVKIPGRGERICWYMWYQVVNRTGKPQQFVPDFELVTLDHPAVHPDEVLPIVEEEVRKLEDRTGYQNIKNSVTISKLPIPVSPPVDKGFPRAVTGVAIWDAAPADPKKRPAGTKDLSDTTRFSIFVRGLSNGFRTLDPIAPGLPPINRYKTLQINFKRVGDRFSVDSRDIVFVPPAEWIYRASGRKIDDDKKGPEKKDK
jgi:hypothetical protein